MEDTQEERRDRDIITWKGGNLGVSICTIVLEDDDNLSLRNEGESTSNPLLVSSANNSRAKKNRNPNSTSRKKDASSKNSMASKNIYVKA
eukprot:8060811-Ditylum_brightwellii.AAC.1